MRCSALLLSLFALTSACDQESSPPTAPTEQVDRTIAGLPWETSLDVALAKAKERGVPVLSLRMLGNLDEELSCANSRFFRTLLYNDPELAAWLPEHFVLHWSSERAVPQVTIDFGDGRVLKTTTTGNSAHYVLDHEGKVIDVVPGLYHPRAFQEQLKGAADLFARGGNIEAYHRDAIAATETRLQPWLTPAVRLWMGAAPGRTDDAPVPAVEAQPITFGKMKVETPLLADLERVAAPTDEALEALSPALVNLPLSAPAIARIKRDRPQRPDETDAAYAARIEALLRSTIDSLARDTLLNEARLHYQIHRWLADPSTDRSFEALNARVYRELFATPASDPWLGLVDDTTYDGLPEPAANLRG